VLASAAALQFGCAAKDGSSTKDKELEVELAKAKASQAQAELEKARLQAKAASAPPPATRVMTAGETAAAVNGYDGPGLSEVVKGQPLVNPPACEKASARMRRYAQCAAIDEATRQQNLKSFAASLDSPPGGDKAAFCEMWLDAMDRNRASFCM
jgi:hypothetical protein